MCTCHAVVHMCELIVNLCVNSLTVSAYVCMCVYVCVCACVSVFVCVFVCVRNSVHVNLCAPVPVLYEVQEGRQCSGLPSGVDASAVAIEIASKQYRHHRRRLYIYYGVINYTSSIARFCYSGRGLHSLPQMGMVI